MNQFTVIFKPQNKSIKVAQGTDLLTAAMRCGIMLHAACGGEGICGKCRCVIEKKDVLACQTLVESDLEVRIPKGSLEHHPKVSHAAEDFTKGVVLKREDVFGFSPLARKFYIELPAPTADDNEGDLDRIAAVLEKKTARPHLAAGLSNIRHLSQVLRESGFKVTVALGCRGDSDEILSVEPGDTSGMNFGLAFDIGTTTVVGQLVDLNTRQILDTRIAFNKQASYGSDVITRIIHASGPGGLEELKRAVLDNINEIVLDLAAASKTDLSRIYASALAGNMTMMHLLLGIDPSNIRKAPYIPAATAFPAMHFAEAGIRANPRALVSILPGVSTYVGGDIVAGIVACGLSEADGLSMLVDIGTNGEIVLGNREWMMAAAASAGPAFEGSGLSSGMKATSGAIQKAQIGGDLNARFETIGGAKPRGICGSGYIDLLCQMLKRGIIGKDGKINRSARSGRIRKSGDVYEFVAAFAKESAGDRDIVVTEDDIENLKRSKGAIYSAMTSLLGKVGKKISELEKIYIAGGFGNYLNIDNGVFIGLLPDVDRNVYEFIGNSSLAGARMALLSREALQYANRICRNITYLDLSSEPNYMDEYIGALFFPHTDIGRFPSVRL